MHQHAAGPVQLHVGTSSMICPLAVQAVTHEGEQSTTCIVQQQDPFVVIWSS